MSYEIFEDRHIEFGAEDYPLNIYGDANNYKPFPEIGDLVNDDSVLMALRKVDVGLSPSLTSINDVREFNPAFDKAIYVKKPGEVKTIRGKEFRSGEVVDIKVWVNPKYKKEIYSGTTEGVEKYANALKKYYTEIIDTYEELKKDHYLRFKDNNLPISEKFHRLIIESLAVANPSKKKISYTHKNEVIDLVRISFTIKYTMTPSVSSKLSDLLGSKGVIVQVRPDNAMPYTMVNGEKVIADVVMDPSSLVSRMNVGRIYEQYFNAMSRKTQYELKKIIGKDINKCNNQQLDQAWNLLLGLYKLIGTEQFTYYNEVKDVNVKKELLKECIEEEVYILYRISSEKRPYQIVLESKGTIST